MKLSSNSPIWIVLPSFRNTGPASFCPSTYVPRVLPRSLISIARQLAHDDRVLSRDGLGRQDDVAIGVAAENRDLFLELKETPGRRSVHHLECRD